VAKREEALKYFAEDVATRISAANSHGTLCSSLLKLRNRLWLLLMDRRRLGDETDEDNLITGKHKADPKKEIEMTWMYLKTGWRDTIIGTEIEIDIDSRSLKDRVII
jgi:hypothetical protein